MFHLPEPARRLSAQILITRPSGWRLGLSHWLIGWLMELEIVFSQSEDGSRLCDHKHLPVGGRVGPEKSDNGSTLTILFSWINL